MFTKEAVVDAHIEYNIYYPTTTVKYEQGYIIRLTPSTVRASYNSDEIYPEIESPEMVDMVTSMYAKELADCMFSDKPNIMDQSSHTENLLIWGNGEHAWTDYSDHAAFSDQNYPIEKDASGLKSFKYMLTLYIKMVEEIPGFEAKRDKLAYCNYLNKTFTAHGVDLEVSADDDYKQIAQKIWVKAMSHQIYKARTEKGSKD